MIAEPEVSVDYLVREWPTLQSKARTGKTKYWQVRVLHSRETSQFLIEVEFWQDNGAHQRQSKKIVGKNIGRANETTPQEQALSEAKSQFVKQQDKGYSTDGQTINPLCLPMLAHDFKARKKAITFPCFGQPKLDGIRCLYNHKQGFWSRGGKPFNAVNLDHLRWEGIDIITLDGELILPEPYTFENTSSAVKKQNEFTPLLEYHIFDAVIAGPFRTRLKTLQILKAETNMPFRTHLVPTPTLFNMSDVEVFLQEYLTQGYEGLILRNMEGEYEIGQRSTDLQKYKEFVDKEFAICAVIDGLGKEEGAAIFTCAANVPGKFFNVRPVGTYEERRAIFQDAASYIGKELTVRYQNLTEDGIPRFPVGRGVRDYE